MTKLYQFILSHYCEKARWALEYKKIPYHPVNLIPVLHVLTTGRLATQTSVPILVHDGKTVQDSTAIISFLDETFPDNSLTPSQSNEAKEAMEWEEYCDREIGPHLRRLIYHQILDDKNVITALFSQGMTAGATWTIMFFLPLIRRLMRSSMNINEGAAQRSEKRLKSACEKINQALAKNLFLVGQKFSRADLTAAALLAPLCWPPEHELKWPPHIPQQTVELRAEFRLQPFYSWVLKMYSQYRNRSDLQQSC